MIKTAAVDVNKRCLLSLNGKSVLVVYDNADRDSAVEAIVDGCFYANGQVFALNLVFLFQQLIPSYSIETSSTVTV